MRVLRIERGEGVHPHSKVRRRSRSTGSRRQARRVFRRIQQETHTLSAFAPLAVRPSSRPPVLKPRAHERSASAPRERRATCRGALGRRRVARESVSGVWGRGPQGLSARAVSECATRTACAAPGRSWLEARRTRERVRGLGTKSPRTERTSGQRVATRTACDVPGLLDWRRGARESVSGVWGRSPQGLSARAVSECATRTACDVPGRS